MVGPGVIIVGRLDGWEVGKYEGSFVGGILGINDGEKECITLIQPHRIPFRITIRSTII
jgi:hypothetical protein